MSEVNATPTGKDAQLANIRAALVEWAADTWDRDVVDQFDHLVHAYRCLKKACEMGFDSIRGVMDDPTAVIDFASTESIALDQTFAVMQAALNQTKG